MFEIPYDFRPLPPSISKVWHALFSARMLEGVINSAGGGMRYAAVALMIGACLLAG